MIEALRRPRAWAAIVLAAAYAFRAAGGLHRGSSYSMGKAAELVGDYERAASHLARGVIGFDRFDALVARAEVRLILHDRATAKARAGSEAADLLAKAATDYVEAASVCPFSGDPWAGLGQVYLRAEQNAYGSRPVTEETDTGWGDVGRPGRLAVGMFRIASERNPEVYTFDDQLLFVLLELGLRDEAVRTAAASARIQPFFGAHGWNLSTFPKDLLEAFGGEARAALGRAPMLARGQHLLSLGRIEHQLGDLEQAGAALEEALAIPSETIHRAEYAYYLARVRADQKRYREAEKALDIAETYPSFLPNASDLRATIAEEEGRLDDALRWLGQARRLDPRNLWYCLKFARIARQVRDHKAAIEALRWGILQHPADPAPRIALVETYVEADETMAAAAELDDLSSLIGETSEVTRLRQLLGEKPGAAGA